MPQAAAGISTHSQASSPISETLLPLVPAESIPSISANHPELKTPSSDSKIETKAKHQFQCTFCHIELCEKSWKRHEESQHLPQSEYVCMPSQTSLRGNRCMFCHTRFSLVELFKIHHQACRHRISDCLKRSIEDRTFSRKDHLMQHLDQFHRRATLAKEDLDTFVRTSATAREREWHCGFCGEKLANWDVRARHVAKHFREGLTMSSWKS